MSKQVHLNLTPQASADENLVKKAAAADAGLNTDKVTSIRILKKSVDARQKNIRVNLSVEVFSSDEPGVNFVNPFEALNVSQKQEVLIVGAGPAGLFAALRLIELGLKPVIIERGRDV